MNKIVQLPDDYNGILLVGEAPGADELSSIRYNEKFGCYVGKPFIGAEGKYLRQCCRQVSFPIEQCAIINTVHEKPFKNAYETLSADAISFGREQLIETINSLKPKLIVAIGGKALEMLTDYRGINKYRGTIVKSSLVEGYRVFSTIHPGFIFKGNPQFDIVLKMDLTKALREFHSPSPDAEMNINVIYDACEARKALYDLCFHQTPVTVDIETGGPKLLAFGVATSKTEAIVIPKDLCKDVSVLKAISEFSNSNVPKIYHNALYDVFYMAYYYKIFTRNIFADTMLAQHAIFPTLQKSLAFCASIYTNNVYWKEEGKEAIKDYSMKKIIDWPAFYIYNGKDCCVTYEVFEKQQEELDYWKTRPTYDLMMRSVPFALVSMLNGFHINHENVKTFSEINEKTIEVLEKIKLGCIGDVNFASPKQVCELIYDKWRLPERKNKGSRTSDDKALSYLATLPTNVQHFMGLIQTTREYLKLRGYYNIKTDPDGKIRVSQKIHGTKTGRWATSECITGSGCVPDTHEVMTKNGWKSIAEVIEGTEILCWNINSTINFMPIKQTFMYEYDDELITSEHSLHPHKYTKTHRIPWTRPNRPFNVEIAEIYANRHTVNIPSSGYYTDGKLHNPNLLRLLAMIQADFSIEPYCIRGSFYKQRKIERARKILFENNLEWTETIVSRGFTRFTIKGAQFIKEYFGQNKSFSWNLLDYNIVSLSAFIDEVSYWDSHIRGNSYIYSTTNPNNAEIVATIAHLVGKSSSTNVNYDNNRGYGQGNNKPLYYVNVKDSQYVNQENFKLVRKEHFKGNVYCVSVPSEFFLCRYNGQIIVTGNSNMQNQPPSVRQFYDAPPGELFIEWDLSNVDARFVAAICEDQDWLNSFDIIDQHSFTAVNIFKLQPFYDKISTLSLETTALQSFANENEDFLVAMYKKVRENYSGGKSYRDYAKKIGHANHYLEQAPKLSVTLGCSKKEAEKLLENYNLLRPKLKKWHDRVRSECSQTRIIRTCFGRVIQFFGPYFNDRLPEAVATEPQSSAGDYLMTGGLNCLEQINEITFALQVHDSIMVSVKNDLEILKKVIPKIKEIAEFDVTVRGQTFKIPVEFKMGLNWGSMKKVTLNNIEKVFEEINK